MQVDFTVDAKRVSCPMVVLKLKKEISGLSSGSVVQLFATDPMSERDIAAFCNASGHQLTDVSHDDDGVLEFLITIS